MRTNTYIGLYIFWLCLVPPSPSYYRLLVDIVGVGVSLLALHSINLQMDQVPGDQRTLKGAILKSILLSMALGNVVFLAMSVGVNMAHGQL